MPSIPFVISYFAYLFLVLGLLAWLLSLMTNRGNYGSITAGLVILTKGARARLDKDARWYNAQLSVSLMSTVLGGMLTVVGFWSAALGPLDRVGEGTVFPQVFWLASPVPVAVLVILGMRFWYSRKGRHLV